MAGTNANGCSGASRGYVERARVRQTKESLTAGKWLVSPGCVGRRPPPVAVRGTCADGGSALPFGLRRPNGTAHFRCHTCSALDPAKHREAAVEAYQGRRDPLFVRKDSFVLCSWMADVWRATSADLPPANAPGLENASGRGGEAPSGGTSLFSTSTHMCGSGTRAEQVAMESADRICLS